MTLDDALKELRAYDRPAPLPVRLPNVAEVDEAESRLGLTFPSDFRRYLLEASNVNVGILEPVTITVPDSHTDLFKVAETAWCSRDVPRDLLPICEDNGDFYCIDAANEIVLWTHDGTPMEKWPSLAAWIENVWLVDA